MLKPVPRQSLSDAVFDQLRGQILSGQLAPGAALPSERELCKLLDVNRGAVREALKRLHEARLVKVQHGGATRVLDFLDTAGSDLLADLLFTADGTIDMRIARSVLEMRAALAPDIAQLCARRGGATTAAVLASLVRAMEAARGDTATMHRLTFDYWDALVQGADNVAYRLIFNSLRRSRAKWQDALAHVFVEELHDVPAYRAIAKAVAAGDADTARRRAARMVQPGVERLTRLVDLIEQSRKKR